MTRGGSTGAGGKGHVKSASVSSPGPSADNGATPDPLGPRYAQIMVTERTPEFYSYLVLNVIFFCRVICV